MATLQKIKIKDCCEITSSKRIFANEYLSSGVPFYRGKEISEKQRSSAEVSDLIYISKDKFEEIKAKYGVPQKGDLLLTSVGTIGNPYLVKEGEEFYFKDGNLTWFRNFQGINGQWLYYWLLSPQGKSELNKCTIGSSQKAYTINLLYGLQIELPDIPTQTHIASILSAYDDLIENNEKRIKALEEMAQLLYTEWFVKFKFSGHEKVKMVDSGTDYGKIPEGWEVKKLGEVCTRIQAGGTPLRSNSTFWHEGIINWYTTGELQDGFLFGSTQQITEESILKTSAKLFDRGTILMAIYGSPTVGRLGRVTGRSSCNQAAIGITPDEHRVGKNFIWYALKKLRLFFNTISSGAAQQNISKEIVVDADILVAPKYLIETFELKAENIWNKIEILSRQNQNLSKTRDLLIPQLVTGRRELK